MKDFLNRLIYSIQASDSVIIMSHRYMDLDGFGASLALYQIAKKYNKNISIVVNENEQDSAITKAKEKIDVSSFHFTTGNNAQNFITDKTLLIILDVHKKEMLEFPILTEMTSNVVIIDHHITGEHILDNVSYSYIKTNVSSTVEIMVDFLKLEGEKVKPIIATIMLAGMYIDTNNFNIKTTVNTYLAGAYLMENGADNIIKQELFQEDRKNIIRRQKLLKNSHMVNKNMIVCILDKNVYTGIDLAKIAEELLQFEEVEASFTIGYVDEKVVGISARSLGKINVEKIMKKMGGGGHKTDAAARIENYSLSKCEEKLLTILK